MSKQTIKKFRKNDWSDEQEFQDNRSNYLEKKSQKKVDRALRTKDISALVEDEDEYAYDNIYDEMADDDGWPDEDERR